MASRNMVEMAGLMLNSFAGGCELFGLKTVGVVELSARRERKE